MHFIYLQHSPCRSGCSKTLLRENFAHAKFYIAALAIPRPKQVHVTQCNIRTEYRTYLEFKIGTSAGIHILHNVPGCDWLSSVAYITRHVISRSPECDSEDCDRVCH